MNTIKRLNFLNPYSFTKKKKKYRKKTEKLGLIYDEITSETHVYQMFFVSLFILNFKKKYIVKTKKIKPGSLLSGQIAKDLKLGDKKIIKDKKARWLLLIFININFKHK